MAGLVVTVDGDAGEVRLGEAATSESVLSPDLSRFADLVRAAVPDVDGDLPALHLAARSARP